MPAIQNTDAITAIRKQARLSISEGFPQVLLNNVQPVMDMSPDFHRLTKTLGENSTTATGSCDVTMPAGKEVYVTGILASYIKNATADTATGVLQITATTDGIAAAVGEFAVLTLTAQYGVQFIPFKWPMKVNAGSTIFITGNFTVGNLIKSLTVYGFEILP